MTDENNQKQEEVKVKKPWYTRWWGILIILFGFFILYDILIYNSEIGQQVRETELYKEQITAIDEELEKWEINSRNLFQGDVSDLFPLREQVDTRYQMRDIEDIEINSTYKNVEVNNLVQAKKRELVIATSTPTFIFIDILKFENQNDARNLFEEVTNNIKNRGGYTEQNTRGINAECFAYETGELLTGYTREVICHKQNIFFSTNMFTYSITERSNYRNVATVIANRISG